MSQASQNHIKTTVSARYWQLGTIDANTRSIWFVLHGQGQLAEFFIRKFECLTDAATVIVAPEALNRYYLEGFTGKVGASWMTKEDRLTDIDNYLSYLNTLYNELVSEIDMNHCTVRLLGFSQGTATVSRWATQGNIRFDQLIIWAGHFPPDLDQDRAHKSLKKKKVLVVYGKNDPYLTPSIIENIHKDIKSLNIECEIVEFEGVHEIDQSTLKELAFT